MITDERLKPCPFCGMIPKIYVCDEEGNIRNDDYESNPWSGLSYAICHDISELKDGSDCPIATHEGEILGTRLYDNIDELVEGWNGRGGVWHNMNVEPEKNKLIVLYGLQGTNTIFWNGDMKWENIDKFFKAIQWAYMDDLTPNLKK